MQPQPRQDPCLRTCDRCPARSERDLAWVSIHVLPRIAHGAGACCSCRALAVRLQAPRAARGMRPRPSPGRALRRCGTRHDLAGRYLAWVSIRVRLSSERGADACCSCRARGASRPAQLGGRGMQPPPVPLPADYPRQRQSHPPPTPPGLHQAHLAQRLRQRARLGQTRQLWLLLPWRRPLRRRRGKWPQLAASIRRSAQASARISSRRRRKASCSSCASSAANRNGIRNSTARPHGHPAGLEPRIHRRGIRAGAGSSPSPTIRRSSLIPPAGTSRSAAARSSFPPASSPAASFTSACPIRYRQSARTAPSSRVTRMPPHNPVSDPGTDHRPSRPWLARPMTLRSPGRAGKPGGPGYHPRARSKASHSCIMKMIMVACAARRGENPPACGSRERRERPC